MTHVLKKRFQPRPSAALEQVITDFLWIRHKTTQQFIINQGEYKITEAQNLKMRAERSILLVLLYFYKANYY